LYDVIDVKPEHMPAIKALFIRALALEAIPQWSDKEDEYPLCALNEDMGHALIILDGSGNALAYAAYHEELEELKDYPWMLSGKPFYFHRLLVDRNVRGKGIAKSMIAALMTRAKELGGKCYRFVVYPENERAISLYERIGLAQLGEFESPWAEYGDGGVIILYEGVL